MAYEVLWTDRAQADLDAVIAYLAIDLASPQAASEHLDAFLDKVKFLSLYPEAHRVSETPALEKRDLRVCLVKKYLMLYSFDGKVVLIHRIFHQRRDYARLIEL